MAQKNRTKELWLVPKRGSLHQTICLIDGIIERNYDGSSWNPQKQNNLGVNLKNWGATQSGKNISSQSIRTLVASIPQYLGFLYINNKTTPNSICLTEVGRKLHCYHKADLKKIPNLIEGKDKLIKYSKIVLEQMEKLQLTNPIYAKDCENILVFPFRATLKLLLRLGYLDREEIAYFLLQIKDESEFELTVKEINNFRNLKSSERKDIIEAFKQTHIGNITLVQAPSAAYYEGLCQITGIIDRFVIRPVKYNKQVNAIRIKEEFLTYAEEIVKYKYVDAETYDFDDNLELWIEYIGNPKRLSPPIDVKIINKADKALLIQLKKESKILNVDLIEEDTFVHYPMFIDEEYEMVLIDVNNGNEISTEKFTPIKGINEYEIIGEARSKTYSKTIEHIAETIMEHSNSTSFYGEALNYLTILNKILNIDKIGDKSLRGAYYEYLFYQLLSKLKDDGIIDDVIWNGGIGKYGLPIQAPGGKTGIADMSFIINNIHYVLELTTIKSKSGQEKAELASVPDHIKIYKETHDADVVGIFCAPIIHERNIAVMNAIIDNYGIKLICISDKDFIDVLLKQDKQVLIEFLSE